MINEDELHDFTLMRFSRVNMLLICEIEEKAKKVLKEQSKILEQ